MFAKIHAESTPGLKFLPEQNRALMKAEAKTFRILRKLHKVCDNKKSCMLSV
jgi:hypothetical protein